MKPTEIIALIPFGFFAATIMILTFNPDAQRWAGSQIAYWTHMPSP